MKEEGIKGKLSWASKGNVTCRSTLHLSTQVSPSELKEAPSSKTEEQDTTLLSVAPILPDVLDCDAHRVANPQEGIRLGKVGLTLNSKPNRVVIVLECACCGRSFPKPRRQAVACFTTHVTKKPVRLLTPTNPRRN